MVQTAKQNIGDNKEKVKSCKYTINIHYKCYSNIYECHIQSSRVKKLFLYHR